MIYNGFCQNTVTKYAASLVVIEGVEYRNYVVELQDGELLKSFRLETELPHVQWVRRVEISEGRLVSVVRV